MGQYEKNTMLYYVYLFRELFVPESMNIWYTIRQNSGDTNNISKRLVMLFDEYWAYQCLDVLILYWRFLYLLGCLIGDLSGDTANFDIQF